VFTNDQRVVDAACVAVIVGGVGGHDAEGDTKGEENLRHGLAPVCASVCARVFMHVCVMVLEWCLNGIEMVLT
jgi:hypothetical protein